ncbi:hypothetical protein HYW94_01370 [Candidatus Uhrbacteria bacterium]|nr:hypothetical protein [Candidatus Uhrbacteria bacterium]
MGEGGQCCSMGGAKSCGCPHHKMMPLFIVLFGLVFLLKTLNVITPEVLDVAWPVIVILAGLFKMTKGMCKCC